jgi:RNA-directed DNA polymerase
VTTRPTITPLQRLQSADSLRSLAALLGVTSSSLYYNVRVLSPSSKYTQFTLRRRNGRTRSILAPSDGLRFLQSQLNAVLQTIYEPKKSAHGFVRDRSILTNASSHAGQRHILNLDLESFFPTIHFGRVRGVFLKEPFLLSEEIATWIAQLCCHEGLLPQGAPTSPVISNLVCRRLDTAIERLARRYRCRYTRYADDITISTNAKTLPRPLAFVPEGAPPNKAVLGDQLREAIESNDFRINAEKTRLTSRDKHQCTVTGLVVNETPTVKRTYIRQVRAMLHAWAVYGEDGAQHAYYEKPHCRQRNPSRGLARFKHVVRGKIEFVGQIRGHRDPIYCSLLQKYADLDEDFQGTVPKALPRDQIARAIHAAMWVLEDEANSWQGSAFLLDGWGLVTCSHVVHGRTIDAFRPDDPTKIFTAEVSKRDAVRDLVVLTLPAAALVGTSGLRAASGVVQGHSHRVYICGFPNYQKGDAVNIRPAAVAAFRMERRERRLLVSTSIVSGMSGGPVLDDSERVVGISAKGGPNEDKASETEDHSVIPIAALSRLGEG